MPITAATLDDIADLAPLFAGYLEFYQVPAPAEQIHTFLEQRLRRQESVVFLARDARGEAQGFVQLYPFFASLALRAAWLVSDLYVLPQARRDGLGEALMNTARAHAEATGACGLQLETARSNLTGQRLYERLGYRRDETYLTYWLDLGAR